MNRYIGARMLAAVLVGVLAPRLGFADTVYTYDFQNLVGSTNAPFPTLRGQDNWVGSGEQFNVISNSTTSNINAMGMSGAGKTGVAYRQNDGNWAFSVEAGDTVKIQWAGRTGTARIMELGFGDATGAVIFKVGNDLTKWVFTPATGAATVSASGPSGPSVNYTYVLECDLAANGGSGLASFSVIPSGGSLTAIADLQNLNMNLLSAGKSATDMTSLYLRSSDAATFDDIAITVAPPSAGPATQISISAGDGQSGVVGIPLEQPLKALVRDVDDNPVPNVAVNFAVATGGGSFASGDPVYSDAGGIATATAWTLGSVAGTNTATATSAGLAGSPLTFTAMAPPPPAYISIHGGNNQTAAAGDTLPLPLQVLVQDGDEIPVAGVGVIFAVATGGGSLGSVNPVLSDTNGIATATWTLGQQAGGQTATATSVGLGGSPLTFTATATVPPFFTYDFNHLTGGDVYLAGQDGWVGTQTLTTGMKARGTTGANVSAGTLSTSTGAGIATAYRACSGDAAWPLVKGVKAFSVAWYSVAGSSRISQLGLGDASGVPFIVIGSSLASWRFTSDANNDTTGGSIGGGYLYFDCLLTVDLVAGTASFFIDQYSGNPLVPSGTWTPVASMQNMALELPLGFVPSDFKTLYLRSRDQGSIDDIVITNIPVPPSGTTIIIR